MKGSAPGKALKGAGVREDEVIGRPWRCAETHPPLPSLSHLGHTATGPVLLPDVWPHEGREPCTAQPGGFPPAAGLSGGELMLTPRAEWSVFLRRPHLLGDRAACHLGFFLSTALSS